MFRRNGVVYVERCIFWHGQLKNLTCFDFETSANIFTSLYQPSKLTDKLLRKQNEVKYVTMKAILTVLYMAIENFMRSKKM
jgi:hypothetical protein